MIHEAPSAETYDESYSSVTAAATLPASDISSEAAVKLKPLQNIENFFLSGGLVASLTGE